MNESSTSLSVADGSGAMFDRIAPRYDLLNRLMSFGIDRRWRRKLIAALQVGAGDTVIDLASGTGDVALAIARRYGAQVLGTDPSSQMLDVATAKTARTKLDGVRFELGVAEHIELPDDAVQGCCISFGIRNVPDRPAALAEMARVTAPGGRVCILELSEPEGGLMAPLARLHVHHIVPLLGSLLSGSREYRYLQRSIAAFPPATEFADMMRNAGLEVLEVERLTFGTAHLYVATPAAEATP